MDARKLHEALEQCRRELAETQAVSGTGSWLWEPDRDRLSWSEQLCRIHGISREEAPETLDEHLELVHPDDRPLVREAAERVLETGEPFELHHRIRGGEGVERVLEMARGERFTNGSLPVLRGTCRDVTEQLALERVRERLAVLVERSHEAILSTDAEGRIGCWNPAAERLLGVPAAEAEGRDLVSFAAERCRDGLEAAMRRAREGEVVRGRDMLLRAADGRLLETTLTLSPLSKGAAGEQDRVLGLGVIVREVGERRRLERRLEQARRLESLGLMAGGIAHDFNNILAAVLGNLDVVLEDIGEGESREALEDVREAAMRAAELVQHLLSLAGRGPRRTRSVDLAPVVHRGLSLLETRRPEGVELERELPAEVPAALADPARLGRVLDNLVLNAFEAVADRGGRVRVRLATRDLDERSPELVVLPEAGGVHVLLEVADDGPGLSDEVRHRMFDPFFTTKAGGRGLGLSSVLGAVRDQGGGLEVESEPGRGTTFRVYLCAAGRETMAGVAGPSPR